MSRLRPELTHWLQTAPYDKIKERWAEILQDAGPERQLETQAMLGRSDRFYLLTQLLHRVDADKPWLYDRCREVEAHTDGYLDLWAREHYKSTIITFAGSIQEILNDPEITICIFSHNRATANKFLDQIKTEFEFNRELQAIYPEVLWANPYKDAPQWSLEKGICVKRYGNPLNATIESAGLVDGMPVGSHYALRVYDDVVTAASVNTPEQVTKATEMYQLSDNLGARGADGLMREWMIGTRYSFADTYQWIIDNKTLKLRIHAATDDGTRTGNPVFLTRAALDEKLAKQESYIFACQQLLNPSSGTEAMFRKGWFKFNDIRPATLNVYIMVDPAGSMKKSSDNTAMSVVGYDTARNKWLLDGYCHKMGLAERWQRIKELRQKWIETPGVQSVFVGYESYSIPDALEHFEERMEIERNYFPITILHWPRQTGRSKTDRIARLEPDIRGGKFIMSPMLQTESGPQQAMREQGQAFRIFTPQRRIDENGRVYWINQVFLNEALVFPFAQHDDFLDATSRIFDMDPRPPVIIDERDLEPQVFSDGS
jgi:phage terminase large subunit-like protein